MYILLKDAPQCIGSGEEGDQGQYILGQVSDFNRTTSDKGVFDHAESEFRNHVTWKCSGDKIKKGGTSPFFENPISQHRNGIFQWGKVFQTQYIEIY